MINTGYHLLVKSNIKREGGGAEKGGGLIKFFPLKRGRGLIKEGALNRGFTVNMLTFVFLFFIESISRFVMYLVRLLPLYNSCV